MSLSAIHSSVNAALNAALVEYWWCDQPEGDVEPIPAAYHRITKEWGCQFTIQDGNLCLVFNSLANETAFILKYS
ncbi:MAG: hypothetical protein RLY43_401 [Bacteroidota bacterium]|jgi:hypothetical protein